MKKDKIDEPDRRRNHGPFRWDGIEELNNPSAALVALDARTAPSFGALGIPSPTPLGRCCRALQPVRWEWSTRAETWPNRISRRITSKTSKVWSRLLIAADLSELPATSDLHRYGIARGGSVFRAQCSQCHGSGAAGSKGYPNLLDDNWLWGGSIDEISTTVAHGIRNETDEDAHFSQMPAFKDILENDDITAVVEYVISLSNTEFNSDLARQGETVYADNCASCHGDDAKGDREQGAPNLADAIWLYGGDRETLTTTVKQARYGVMPAWGQRLSDEDVRAVSLYVHALGGGE